MAEVKPIVLGDEVEDTITGFKGTAICRAQWITGCDRITVQPRGLTKEGKTFDCETFDEFTLKVAKRAGTKKKATKKGGPRPSPVKHGK